MLTHALQEDITTLDKRVAYAVSGDETLREFGRYGRRQSTVDLWSKVRPERLTAGINVGTRIRTWQGIGTVTRVGTIAGWYTINGREDRWTIQSVREIIIEEN